MVSFSFFNFFLLFSHGSCFFRLLRLRFTLLGERTRDGQLTRFLALSSSSSSSSSHISDPFLPHPPAS